MKGYEFRVDEEASQDERYRYFIELLAAGKECILRIQVARDWL